MLHTLSLPSPLQVVSLAKSSETAPYHALQHGQEAHWEVCERLLFVYSKINKGLRYVQVRETHAHASGTGRAVCYQLFLSWAEGRAEGGALGGAEGGATYVVV